MKKIFLFILVIFCVFFCIDTNAKTLGDLKNELAQLEKQKAEQDSKKKLTQDEMNKVNSRIDTITKTIEASENKIKDLSDEIIVLEEKSMENKSRVIYIKSINELSNILSLPRPSVSRELINMVNDKIITKEKNIITLL